MGFMNTEGSQGNFDGLMDLFEKLLVIKTRQNWKKQLVIGRTFQHQFRRGLMRSFSLSNP